MVVFCVCFLVPDDDDDDDDDGSGGSSSTPKAKYVSSLVTSLCTRVAQLGPRLVMPLPVCSTQQSAVSTQQSALHRTVNVRETRVYFKKNNN